MARSSNKPTGTEQAYPGVISMHELYTLTEAKRRLGWSESAFRAARRRGLAVLACGKRRYVTGGSLFRFLENGGSKLPS